MFAILCGMLLVPVGLGISAYYLTRIRPEIASAENGELPPLG